jgi:hypothetical protein
MENLGFLPLLVDKSEKSSFVFVYSSVDKKTLHYEKIRSYKS